MANTNRRTSAGGNPAQAPHPDVANPTPGPTVGNDFPDAPEEHEVSRDQDKPDLDAFAARLGIDTLDDSSPVELAMGEDAGQSGVGETRDAPPAGTQAASGSGSASGPDWRAPLVTAVGGVASGARGIAERLRSVAGRIGPEDAAADDDDRDGQHADIDLATLRERVSDVRTVMVTTGDERGTLSSRPLTVQRVTEDGDVLFIVDQDADWVRPGVDAVNVAFVRGDRTWISVAGRAVTDDDARLIDELWNPMVETFFPDGRDRAVVLRAKADRWEYWTAPNKLRQLVEIATSKFADEEPDLGESGVVET